MKKILTAASCLLILALSTLTTSCLDDKDDTLVFAAFATLTTSNDQGTVFTTRAGADDALVTLTTVNRLDEKTYPTGRRYLITYSNESNQQFKSGPIDLRSILPVENGDVTTAPLSEIKDMQLDLITLSLLQREGTYINIEASAPLVQAPKTFGLFVDAATVDSDLPDVYVGFVTDSTGGNYYIIYGSFDIASLWNKASVRGVRIHFWANGQATYRDLMKN